jgi:hypothetical protein
MQYMKQDVIQSWIYEANRSKVFVDDALWVYLRDLPRVRFRPGVDRDEITQDLTIYTFYIDLAKRRTLLATVHIETMAEYQSRIIVCHLETKIFPQRSREEVDHLNAWLAVKTLFWQE